MEFGGGESKNLRLFFDELLARNVRAELAPRRSLTAYNPRMNYWPVLAAAAIALVFLWYFWKARERSRQISIFAQENRFRWLDDDLPADIRLASSSISNVSSVWNAIDGTTRGVRVVAFDCRVGQGKGSWRTTVIAVKADSSAVKASDFEINLEKERVGDWTLLFRRAGPEFYSGCMMSAEELKGYIEAI